MIDDMMISIDCSLFLYSAEVFCQVADKCWKSI